MCIRDRPLTSQQRYDSGNVVSMQNRTVKALTSKFKLMVIEDVYKRQYMYESGDKFYTISLRDESGDIFANVEFRTV